MINVVILAAGDGERLGFCVKSIVPIGDTCTMQNIVTSFETLGRRLGEAVRFVVTAGFRADELRGWLATTGSGSERSVVYDELFYKKETGASLAMAFDGHDLSSGTFVVNADMFIVNPTSPNLTDALARMRRHHGLGILGVECEPDDEEAVRLMVCGAGHELVVDRIVRGPGFDANLEAVGIYHLSPTVVQRYQCRERSLSQEDVYMRLHDAGGVEMRVFVTDEFIKEIDDRDDLDMVVAFATGAAQVPGSGGRSDR